MAIFASHRVRAVKISSNLCSVVYECCVMSYPDIPPTLAEMKKKILAG
jgi:hypothetical protein